MCLVGCNTLRQVSVVKESTHDTLYLNKIQYDSIFIDNWHEIDRSNDTVTIREILRENRYKFIKDTIRVISVDSIPVIHEIEVIKTERYLPWYAKVLSVLGAILILLIIICVIRLVCVRL